MTQEFEVSLRDVKLVEVTLDRDTFVTTPVDGGDCLTLADTTISVAGGGDE